VRVVRLETLDVGLAFRERAFAVRRRSIGCADMFSVDPVPIFVTRAARADKSDPALVVLLAPTLQDTGIPGAVMEHFDIEVAVFVVVVSRVVSSHPEQIANHCEMVERCSSRHWCTLMTLNVSSPGSGATWR